MSMISVLPKTFREPEQYNPADYDVLAEQATPGAVQLASPQVQPQVPMQAPAAAQPVQPVQPAQAPAPVPAPVPAPAAQPQWNVQAPGGVPVAQPQPMAPGTWNVQGQGGQAIPRPVATPAQSAPSDVMDNGAARRDLALATQQRKQATNARFEAAGKPIPYPEAVPQGPAMTEVPTSYFPEGTSTAVAEAAKKNPDVAAALKSLEQMQGKTITDAMRKRIKQGQETVRRWLPLVTSDENAKELEKQQTKNAAAAKLAKDEADAKQIKDEKEKKEAIDNNAISAATEAARLNSSGDHDGAGRLIQEKLANADPGMSWTAYSKMAEQLAKAKAAKQAKLNNDFKASVTAAQTGIAKVKAEIELAAKNAKAAKERANDPFVTPAEQAKAAADAATFDGQVKTGTETMIQMYDDLSALQLKGAGTATIEPPRVANDADYNKLQSGTEFIDSDGKRWRKP